MWYLESANCMTPRVLFVHGGSWMYGSPFTDSYPQLASKLARAAQMVVMLPDYPLVPVGNASAIVDHVLVTIDWLATHGPHGCENIVGSAPPLFIGGDSSGGGSAISALLALQTSPRRLAAGHLKVAGGFFFSPWTNLLCNTPDYYLKPTGPSSGKAK